MLIVATTALTLVMMLAGLLVGTYHNRVERDFSRIPVSWATGVDRVDSGPRWRIIADTAEGRWVHVIVLVPGQGAELPPGLSVWPEPGEGVLSPALAGTRAGEEITDRYGHGAGHTLGMDGVVSRTERIAYVRPTDDVLPQVTGLPFGELGVPFDAGVDQVGLIGGAAYQPTLPMALTEFGLTFFAPGVVLMAAAARAGSRRRDRRLLVLRVLGAGPRVRLAVLRGSLGVPLVIGGAAAVALSALLLVVDFPVPGSGYTLLARDARASSPLMAGGLIVGWLLCLMIAMLMNVPRRSRGTRVHVADRPERAWKILGLPAVCLLAVITLVGTAGWEDNTPRIWLVYGSVALVALAIGPFIGASTALVARGVIALGRRTGAAALIIAGRQLLGDPKAVRRLATGTALLVVLVAVSLVLSTLNNSKVREAQSIQEEYGTSVLEIAGFVETPAQQSALREALGAEGGAVLARSLVFDDRTALPTVITGDCAALEDLSLTCVDGEVELDGADLDPRVRLLAGPGDPDRASIRVADPFTASEGELYAVSRGGTDLPVDGIKRELAQKVLPAPEGSAVGDSWIAGLAQSRDKARWNTVGAGAATVLLGLALAAAVLGDTGAASRRAGVLSMWGAGRGSAALIVIGRVLLPLIVAVVSGGLTTMVLTYPLTLPPLDARLPADYFVATIALPLLAACGVALVGAATQARELARWRPGGSE